MMGRLNHEQEQFFYSFRLDEAVPEDHPVREIAAVVDLSWVHCELAPYYPKLGRPSIDPVLMIRMLIVGYVFAIRSERALCRDVQVNLAYRWFCGLSIEDKVPDHSAFSRARDERFRDSGIFRSVFERVVGTCIAAGLVGGAGEVRLRIPKLRQQTFETAIIERYRRRESSVEEALIEMYLAGVSVRRVRGYHRGFVGDAGVALDGVRAEQEDLRNDRDLAQSADRGRASLRVPGRHRAQAQLGRRGAQRLAAGGDRCKQRRLSRDSRHLRRRQGGQGGLERVPQTPQRTRATGRPAHHLGRLSGAFRECGRVLPRRSLAALYRALGTATSSVTFPRPRCGRSRRCSRRFMPARTSWRHARRLSE